MSELVSNAAISFRVLFALLISLTPYSTPGAVRTACFVLVLMASFAFPPDDVIVGMVLVGWEDRLHSKKRSTSKSLNDKELHPGGTKGLLICLATTTIYICVPHMDSHCDLYFVYVCIVMGMGASWQFLTVLVSWLSLLVTFYWLWSIEGRSTALKM
jgi:hypothetical protein